MTSSAMNVKHQAQRSGYPLIAIFVEVPQMQQIRHKCSRIAAAPSRLTGRPTTGSVEVAALWMQLRWQLQWLTLRLGSAFSR